MSATLGTALAVGVVGGTAAARTGATSPVSSEAVALYPTPVLPATDDFDPGPAPGIAAGSTPPGVSSQGGNAAGGTPSGVGSSSGSTAGSTPPGAGLMGGVPVGGTPSSGAGLDSAGMGRAVSVQTAPPVTAPSVAVPVRQKTRPVVVKAGTGAAAPAGTGAANRAAWVNPNPAGSVTSCFGPRWGRQHAGVDLAGPDGSPILAAGAGVVVRAGAAQGYGNAVLIDHGNGYLTHYGHMSAITVVVGQHVTPGQQIGLEGSTGHSTGPHLHFEVHRGYYQNPIEPTRWMHDHGVDIPGCSTVGPH